MTDYTPTTDSVKQAWALWRMPFLNKRYAYMEKEIADAEFDRWLRQTKAEAWREGYAAAEIHLHPVSMAEAPPINPHETETT